MKNGVRMLALATAIVLVGSLTLTAFGLMTWRLFWVIALLAAGIAYYVIPSMNPAKPPAE